MQVITVTKDFLFSNACTYEMLVEIATHKDFCGMSLAAVEKLSSQDLRNGSSKKGSKSHASGDMPYAKLRTVMVQKLQDSPDVGEAFKSGTMQFEMQHMPDLDINAAGKNKSKSSGQRASNSELKGAYEVVKRGLKASEESDPGKWAIWQHIWNCTTFEEYFAKAPKKSVTRTNRVITASSEIRWAIKSKWIKPVSNNTEQQS